MFNTPDLRADSPAATTGRRSLLRAAAWTAPAVTLAAAAPAFADSSADAASLRFSQSSDDTGEIVVANTGDETLTVNLEFTPAPDEDTVGALMAYSGFDGFRRTSSDPFVLSGEVLAHKQVSAWTWWRDRASASDPTATTTVRLLVDGTLVDEVTVSLGA